MADRDTVLFGNINYWCREKYYHHMNLAVTEGLKRYVNDVFLKFFNGFSLILEDRVQEGMRELDPLRDKADINLGATVALLYGHKKSKTVDKEAMQQLDAKLKEERRTAGEKALYYAGLFLFHTQRYDKAKEYIDRMLKQRQDSKPGLALKGWLELMSGDENGAKSALKFFDLCLGQEGAPEVEALLGKARCLEMRHNFSGALELINRAIITYPDLLPALIEKMKIQLELQDWEQMTDTALRALSADEHCLEAKRHVILQLLCREGNYAEAAEKLSDLVSDLERREPKAHQLFHDYARVFSRVCGRNVNILQQTYSMQERALSLDSSNAEYATELGHELVLQGRYKDALKCYRSAMKLDESSVVALTGTIRCQLAENQLDDAAQHIEFLTELQTTIGKATELSYLRAVLAVKRQKPVENVLPSLDEAVDSHFAALKGISLGMEYFAKLNPDFLIQIIREYLAFAPTQPGMRGQPPHPILKQCLLILEPLTKATSGLLEALFLMSNVKYLIGEVEAAQSTLQHCIDKDPTYADAHILMAQIYLHQNNFKMASNSLDVSLSHNFEVREHLVYHLIRARIHKKQGEHAEAIKTLQTALTLPGVRTTTVAISNKKARSTPISLSDRVSVFLELAEAHRLIGEQHEAAKVMSDAQHEFTGTSEEVRITIANADLALGRGDVDGALTMLRNIPPEQQYFVQARIKMADIYLTHRKDRRLYVSCYRELVEKNSTSHSRLLLGDAYMSIQEPEKAIEVYEAALKQNARDPALASKIGQALVKTHNYAKAINYYEAALKQGGQQFLRHDLANLLLKLKHFDKAEKILRGALEAEENPTELDLMIEHTKYYLLLSKVYQQQEKFDDSVTNRTKAYGLQMRVLKRAQIEQPDAYPAQKQLAVSICHEMAQHAVLQRDYNKAIHYYKEALTLVDSDAKVMLELARLYLIIEDLDACQYQCMVLLKNDTDNDDASMMLADLMFRKSEHDQAMHHFKQLLERKPDHYEALAHFVDLMRRAGKLDELPKFFELAESMTGGRSLIDAGFNYCKGLQEWYGGNVNQALKYFNKARKDSDWGIKAIYNMIEICLNPDNETLGGEAFESVDEESANNRSKNDKTDSEQMALRTAEKLLKEVRNKRGDSKAKILDNMWLIATKNKAHIDKALSSLGELVVQEPENCAIHYAMAAAFMMTKNPTRARTELKHSQKSNWTVEEAEDLEKSWLLLADIHIQAQKYDMATEALKKCLQYNKSCCKAYEYMGFINEKEQAFKDAAKNYELAWKYGNKNNPNIGYKLAYNYLRARRFTDAIDICHHVLSLHPNYPKIQKEILEKARANLRMG